jgi:transposase-like protein
MTMATESLCQATTAEIAARALGEIEQAELLATKAAADRESIELDTMGGHSEDSSTRSNTRQRRAARRQNLRTDQANALAQAEGPKGIVIKPSPKQAKKMTKVELAAWVKDKNPVPVLPHITAENVVKTRAKKVYSKELKMSGVEYSEGKPTRTGKKKKSQWLSKEEYQRMQKAIEEEERTRYFATEAERKKAKEAYEARWRPVKRPQKPKVVAKQAPLIPQRVDKPRLACPKCDTKATVFMGGKSEEGQSYFCLRNHCHHDWVVKTSPAVVKGPVEARPVPAPRKSLLELGKTIRSKTAEIKRTLEQLAAPIVPPRTGSETSGAPPHEMRRSGSDWKDDATHLLMGEKVVCTPSLTDERTHARACVATGCNATALIFCSSCNRVRSCSRHYPEDHWDKNGKCLDGFHYEEEQAGKPVMVEVGTMTDPKDFRATRTRSEGGSVLSKSQKRRKRRGSLKTVSLGQASLCGSVQDLAPVPELPKSLKVELPPIPARKPRPETPPPTYCPPQIQSYLDGIRRNPSESSGSTTSSEPSSAGSVYTRKGMPGGSFDVRSARGETLAELREQLEGAEPEDRPAIQEVIERMEAFRLNAPESQNMGPGKPEVGINLAQDLTMALPGGELPEGMNWTARLGQASGTGWNVPVLGNVKGPIGMFKRKEQREHAEDPLPELTSHLREKKGFRAGTPATREKLLTNASAYLTKNFPEMSTKERANCVRICVTEALLPDDVDQACRQRLKDSVNNRAIHELAAAADGDLGRAGLLREKRALPKGKST